MNPLSVIPLSKRTSAFAPVVSLKMRLSKSWQAFAGQRFAKTIVGNPLHEAWTVTGEPLERMSHDELVKSYPSRYLIIPHGRGR